MKRLVALLLCCFTMQAFAQDSTKTKLKQYLGVLTLSEKYRNEKAWTQDAQAIVGQHFQRLIKLKEEGIVILAGRTEYNVDNPDMAGLVIFYAADDKAASQLMNEDPAVKNNIMLAKVHPYSVAINKCN